MVAKQGTARQARPREGFAPSEPLVCSQPPERLSCPQRRKRPSLGGGRAWRAVPARRANDKFCTP
jgi:hypothetical protein